MKQWLRELDDLLRGSRTDPRRLAEGRIDLPLGRFVVLAIVLGATYGFFMGWYAILGRKDPQVVQLISSMVKLPLLFFVTLVVTFPSLYVFNALVGCRLSALSTLKLLVGAIAVNVTVAASLGPILAFFTLNTDSYPFMVVLNVMLLGISGIVGLSFLLQTLRRLSAATAPPLALPVPAAEGETPPPAREPGALDPRAVQAPPDAVGSAKLIFRIWVLIYALVGAQTGWLLRPFIGSPTMEFAFLRVRDGNVFASIAATVKGLIGG